MLKLSDFLDSQLIKVPLAARTKTDAITELVDLVVASGRTHDRQRLLDAVMARERQRTTAVGRGLAIPHAKCDCCPSLTVAIGRTAEPMVFEAIDGRPVRLVVLLSSPIAQASLQIQVLAKVSRLVLNDDTFAKLIAAPTSEALLEVVRAFETG